MLIHCIVEGTGFGIRWADRTALSFNVHWISFTGEARADLELTDGNAVLTGADLAIVQLPPLPIYVLSAFVHTGGLGLCWFTCTSVTAISFHWYGVSACWLGADSGVTCDVSIKTCATLTVTD